MKWSRGEYKNQRFIIHLEKENGERINYIRIEMETSGFVYVWTLHRPGETRFLDNRQEVEYYLKHPENLYMEELL